MKNQNGSRENFDCKTEKACNNLINCIKLNEEKENNTFKAVAIGDDRNCNNAGVNNYLKLYKIIFAVAILIVLKLISFISFSHCLFEITNPSTDDSFVIVFESCQKKLRELSFFSYVMSTITSLIIYSFTSSIECTIVSGIILEYKEYSMKIAQVIFNEEYKRVLDLNRESTVSYTEFNVDSIVITTFFSMFLSSFLLSLISFLLAYTKSDKYLKNIPSISINIFMTLFGLSYVLRPLRLVQILNKCSSVFKVTTVLIIFIFGFGMHVFNTLFNTVLLIPTSTLIIVFVYQILKNFFKIDNLCVFSCNYDKIYTPITIYQDILCLKGQLLLTAVLKSIPYIVTGTLNNSINIFINVSLFSHSTGTNPVLSKELISQCYSNLASAFCGYPVCFINTQTLYMWNNNCKPKHISIITAFALFLCSFHMKIFFNYIPDVLGDIISIFFGCSIIHNYFIDPLFEITVLEQKILLFGVFLGLFFEPIFVFLFIITGMLFAIQLNYYKKFHRIRVSDTLIDRYGWETPLPSNAIHSPLENVIKFKYPLCFVTKDLMINDLQKIQQYFAIDLSECSFIDYDCSIALANICESMNNTITIIGIPYNWNRKIFEGKVLYSIF